MIEYQIIGYSLNKLNEMRQDREKETGECIIRQMGHWNNRHFFGRLSGWNNALFSHGEWC